jgi:Glutamine amidotransferase domain
MSRIAGILSTAHPCSALAAGLLAGLARPGWQRTQLERAVVALGAVGWRTPVTARRGDRLVTVDGTFFNRDELPAGDNDAERFVTLCEQAGIDAALSRINGDFAIAMWNARAMARDRFGLKPLAPDRRRRRRRTFRRLQSPCRPPGRGDRDQQGCGGFSAWRGLSELNRPVGAV